MALLVSLVSLFDFNINSFFLHCTDAASFRFATECHAKVFGGGDEPVQRGTGSTELA